MRDDGANDVLSDDDARVVLVVGVIASVVWRTGIGWYSSPLLISRCVAMSAAGHADAGNVMQDDDTQAKDDYDNGLDDGHQTDTDSECWLLTHQGAIQFSFVFAKNCWLL